MSKTWSAIGVGTWSTGTNWNPVGVPGASDDVRFDATSVANCIIDTGINVNSVTATSAYTGSITSNQNLSHVINGDLSLANPSFTLGNGSTLTISGSIALTPGTVWNTSANATIILAGAGGVQTVDFGITSTNALNIADAITLNCFGAIKRLANNLATRGMAVNRGILDFNNLTIAIAPAGFTAPPGGIAALIAALIALLRALLGAGQLFPTTAPFSVTSPGDITINTRGPVVAGSFNLLGNSAIIHWDSDSQKSLFTGLTGFAHYAIVRNSDASSGAQILANDRTNTDNAGNLNWIFQATVPTVTRKSMRIVAVEG